MFQELRKKFSLKKKLKSYRPLSMVVKKRLRRLTRLKSFHSSEKEIEPILLINKNIIVAVAKEKKNCLKKSQLFALFFSKFFTFLNSNDNNFAMPEVGTIEKYILKAHTKFEVNRLNRTRDFMSTRLIKLVLRKTR